ncbi:hypothetical protein NK145_004960, partial [Salmonella enterica]|nr:hypothetical protein [Salmonella enterica]
RQTPAFTPEAPLLCQLQGLLRFADTLFQGGFFRQHHGFLPADTLFQSSFFRLYGSVVVFKGMDTLRLLVQQVLR